MNDNNDYAVLYIEFKWTDTRAKKLSCNSLKEKVMMTKRSAIKDYTGARIRRTSKKRKKQTPDVDRRVI